MIWQAAVVLPHARQVLETRLRKLARSLFDSRASRSKSSIENGLACRAEARGKNRISPPSHFVLRRGSLARADAASEGWCGCRELHPDMLPGEEPFSLLNHNRGN